IISKSLIWYSSTQKLEQSLLAAHETCVEIAPPDFAWVQENPYNIIDNWSLPTLALVMQDSQPRKLLLEKNDCGAYYASGKVQIDPWTNLPRNALLLPPREQ